MATKQAAIFVDFENLAIGAERALPADADRVSRPALERLSREFGRAVVRRAYADWSVEQFGKYQDNLAQNAFDLVQVKRFGCQQKNAADVRMAVDAMEALTIHPRIEVYVLVAGDGDFSPLVKKLREYGKTVVGVGAEATVSKRLMAVCDDYRHWCAFVEAVTPAPEPAPGQPELAAARDLVIRALSQLRCTSVTASALKNKMLGLDPSFDERKCGYARFGQLVAAMEDSVVVEHGQADLLVSIRRQGPATRAPQDRGPATHQGEEYAHLPLLQTLRKRRIGMPASAEARETLLSTVYVAWRAGQLSRVSDIGRVLQNDSDKVPSNALTRGPLRTALVQEDAGVISLLEAPDDLRPLGACRLVPFDGSTGRDWVRRAHIAWLAFAVARLQDQPDLADRLRGALFDKCSGHGRQLVDAALDLAASRGGQWHQAV